MEIEKKITLDLLDVNAPALSSTNDVPKVETKPDASPAAPAKPEVKAEAEKSPAESAPAEQPEADPPASDEPKKAKGVQKRIDELTRQAREAERLAEAERENNRRLLALLENKDKPKVAPEEDAEPVKPLRSAFEKPEDFDVAMDEYIAAKATTTANKAVKAALEEQEKKVQQKAIDDGHKAVRETYAARVLKASDKYPDYQEVAESPDVQVSIPMAHAILHSEHGPDIAYHLGKNPAEAERISKLNPPLQLVELGLIVAKLNQPAALPPEEKPAAKPPVSNAPKPIKPLGAGSDKVAKTPEEETMDEYAARRKKELNTERRPGTRH